MLLMSFRIEEIVDHPTRRVITIGYNQGRDDVGWRSSGPCPAAG